MGEEPRVNTKVPNTVWEKGAGVQRDVSNSESDQVVLPELFSQVIAEPPVPQTIVPPNFKKLVRERYLGNPAKLDDYQKSLMVDCYTKHLRQIDLSNKGAVAAKVLYGFAYSVKGHSCVSHYFLKADYEGSLIARIDDAKGQCFFSNSLGRLKLPIRYDLMQDSYLMIESPKPVASTPDAVENEADPMHGKDFWNESKNFSGTFMGPVALVLNRDNSQRYLDSEFAIEKNNIRGAASEPEREPIHLKLSQQNSQLKVELRLKTDESWGEWEVLGSCYGQN